VRFVARGSHAGSCATRASATGCSALHAIPDGAAFVAANAEETAAWWDAATGIGIASEQDRGLAAPGRWRRLELYGHISGSLGDTIRGLSEVRPIFQHHYADQDEVKGGEVWDEIQLSLAAQADITRALVAFRDQTWPTSSTSTR